MSVEGGPKYPFGYLGRWELLGVVGQGRLGSIWAATGSDGSEVEILRIPLAAWDGLLGELRQQVSVAAALDAPQVSLPLDVMADGNGVAIVSKPRSGASLRQLVSGGPTPLEGAEEVIGEVATAVSALHEIGLIHGSLSPDTIFIDGASIQIHDAIVVPVVLRPQAWGFGAWGDTSWVDPTALAGRTLDRSSDVYSLAACGYYALTGNAPGSNLLRRPPWRLPGERSTYMARGELAQRIHDCLITAPQARPPVISLRVAQDRGPAERVDHGGAARARHTLHPGGARPFSRVVAQHNRETRLAPETVRRWGSGHGRWTGMLGALVAAGVLAVTMGGHRPLHGRPVGMHPALSGAGPCLGVEDPFATEGVSPRGARNGGGPCGPGARGRGGRFLVAMAPGGPPRWFSLGSAGDQVLLGRWACQSRPAPALYVPSRGTIFYYDAWPGQGRSIRPYAEESTGVMGGVASVVRARCDHVTVLPRHRLGVWTAG